MASADAKDSKLGLTLTSSQQKLLEYLTSVAEHSSETVFASITMRTHCEKCPKGKGCIHDVRLGLTTGIVVFLAREMLKRRAAKTSWTVVVLARNRIMAAEFRCHFMTVTKDSHEMFAWLTADDCRCGPGIRMLVRSSRTGNLKGLTFDAMICDDCDVPEAALACLGLPGVWLAKCSSCSTTDPVTKDTMVTIDFPLHPVAPPPPAPEVPPLPTLA
jgi:hypothetical protein